MIKNIQKEREEQLEDLDNFIDSTKKELTQIVSSFGWTLDSISNDVHNFVICPFDRAHRIPAESLEKHLAVCQWKAEGYGKDDVPMSEPTLSLNSPSTIQFDEQLQDEVLLKAKRLNPAMRTAGVGDRLIPRTSDRLIADFTSDERRAIYDYAIANTVKPDIGEDIADMNKSKSNDGDLPKMSFLELLAKERNLKRRRAKHRGVHTNKKSQVEILREVINQQMEMYVEYITDSSIKQEPTSPGTSQVNSTDYFTNDFGNNQQSSRSGRYQTDSTETQSRGGNRYDRDSSRRRNVSDDSHNKYQNPRITGRTEGDLIDRKCTKVESFCDWDGHRERYKSTEREKRSRHSDRRKDSSRETVLSEDRKDRHRSRDRKTHKDKHRSRERHDVKRKHRSRDRDRSRHKKHHSRNRDRSKEKKNHVDDEEPR